MLDRGGHIRPQKSQGPAATLLGINTAIRSAKFQPNKFCQNIIVVFNPEWKQKYLINECFGLVQCLMLQDCGDLRRAQLVPETEHRNQTWHRCLSLKEMTSSLDCQVDSICGEAALERTQSTRNPQGSRDGQLQQDKPESFLPTFGCGGGGGNPTRNIPCLGSYNTKSPAAGMAMTLKDFQGTGGT
ncbi:hypothetical protein O3P69_002324 [Scylla paramamosain]|uniref:Uncharacterized protein n=1 Tax=Scylla paramamosain TaxID=85552 RepID=A0AAW0V672_SCYPA